MSTLEWGGGGLELIFVLPGTVVFGPQYTCSKIYMIKSVHVFVHRADLVCLSAGVEPAGQRCLRWG